MSRSKGSEQLPLRPVLRNKKLNLNLVLKGPQIPFSRAHTEGSEVF